jgi:hypothetical protein
MDDDSDGVVQADPDSSDDEDDEPIATSSLMPKKKPPPKAKAKAKPPPVAANKKPAAAATRKAPQHEAPWASDTLLALLSEEGETLEKTHHSEVVSIVWKRIHRNKLQVRKNLVDATDDPLMWRFFGERKLKNDGEKNALFIQIMEVVLMHVRRKGEKMPRVSEPGFKIRVGGDDKDDDDDDSDDDDVPRRRNKSGGGGGGGGGGGKNGGGGGKAGVGGEQLRNIYDDISDEDDLPANAYERVRMKKRQQQQEDRLKKKGGGAVQVESS